MGAVGASGSGGDVGWCLDELQTVLAMTAQEVEQAANALAIGIDAALFTFGCIGLILMAPVVVHDLWQAYKATRKP